MAQCWVGSTYHGRFINQFLSNIIRSIRQFERVDKKYVDKKCLLFSIKYVLMKKCCQYISSSSSYRAGSTDIPDPLSPLLPIVHRPR